MKIKFLKFKILSIFALLVLSVSLNGCSDDDDEIVSFLENNANSSWKFSDSNAGTTLYVQINNNELNPFEIWISFLENSCFIHESINDDGTPEILENSKNEIVIKVIDNSHEYSIFTLTVNGDTLTVLSEYYEDEVLVEEEIFIFLKTSDSLSDLEICEL